MADTGCDSTAYCSFLQGLPTCGTCAPRLAEGEACSLDLYRAQTPPCQEGLLCIGEDVTPERQQSGTCERIVYGSEGASCEWAASTSSLGGPAAIFECAPPLTCIAGTCGALHARLAGDACDTDEDCADGLFCPSPSTSDTSSTCRPKAPISAGCDRDEACLSGLCCSYGPCAGETFRCIEPADLGEPCFGGNWCKAGLTCDDAAGVCAAGQPMPDPLAVPPGLLGDACDDATRPCTEGLVCGAGTCESAGEYCAAHRAP